MLRRVLGFLDRPPPWIWSALLVALAVIATTAALVLPPGADEYCTLFGRQFGKECGFTVMTGYPCPQCGMTRSFVWGVRGRLIRAFWYNPAGLTLFLWIQAGGIVGLVRLARARHDALRPPTWLLLGWTLIWLVGLYAVGWMLRLMGINPLPG